MAFNKITNADLVGKGVTGLPDVPGLSTGAMQAKFDELSLDVIVPAYNALIDLLNGTGVADNSQITDPTDSVVKSLQALANSLKSYIDTRDATKADKATTLAGYGITDAYTKSETDVALGTKADIASSLAGYGILDAYTKTQTDNLLSAKANAATTLAGYGITDAYTKNETDTALAGKADKATTLSGYGITDAYTKTQTDNALANKVDKVSGKGLSTNDYDNTEKSANAANTTARHTHTNKTTLDAIDATTKGKYDALVTLLNGIVEIEAAVTNDATKIPTGAAIVAYVQGLGGGDMLKSVYDTNNDGVVDDAEKLDGQAASYYTNSANHSYDNTTSGLSATTTKDAIDELASRRSSGHAIENPSGTDMTQRANLQFVDAHITDNASDNKTEVEIVKEVTEADFDALNPQGTEYDGAYLMEVAGATPLTADMVGYDGGTVKGALDGLKTPDYDSVMVIGKSGGKKVKRVMFNYANSVAAGSSQILGTISDLGHLLSIRGGCVSTGNYYPVPFADDVSAKVLRLTIIGGTNVIFYNNLTAPFSDIYCIVEYVSTESI